MAKRVVISTTLTLGGNSYDAQISEASLPIEVATQDGINMDSQGWSEPIGGIKSGNLTITFKKDADMSGLDAAMFAALGTALAFTIKGTSEGTSATNAIYSGSVLITSWTPISGAVGDLHGASYTWPTTGVVSRATS